MSFFIRGNGDLRTGRYVDAYNNFFLFVETQFLRSTDTKKAVASLLASAEFMAGLQASVDAVGKNRQQKPMIFDDALRRWATDPLPLVKEIVLLRGKLRHHSLRHQERGDPTKHGAHEEEAHFLARVAQAIAFPETVNVFLNEPYQGRFLAMADEVHQTIVVNVRITARFNEQIHDVALNMKFPQRSPSLQLAREVLNRSLSTFDERSPGAQLIALRATIAGSGVELLRFEVGGSLPR
jgi:hypothetical protein